jgi:hypothetical protein
LARQYPAAKLGNKTNLAEASAIRAQAARTAADRFASNVMPIVREIQAGGATTMVDVFMVDRFPPLTPSRALIVSRTPAASAAVRWR